MDKGICLTDVMRTANDTLLFFTGQDDEADTKPAKKPTAKAKGKSSPIKNKTAGGKVLRNKTRSAAQEEVVQSTAAKIAGHQKELHGNLQTDGLARYSEEGSGGAGKEGKGWKRFQSYKGEAALPRETETLRVSRACFHSTPSDLLQIYVDRKAQTVIIPIHGFAVPFHINTIKNVSKNDEGDFTYLRLNFQTPGQLAGKKEDTVWLLAAAHDRNC
jgi:nucleosome binding factor SPN SPT16 subunit